MGNVGGPGLESLALQRTSLLLEPLPQNWASPYMVHVVTVSEVYTLLDGEPREIERSVLGASETPTIELPTVRGYYGPHLLIREVWNLRSRAKYTKYGRLSCSRPTHHRSNPARVRRPKSAPDTPLRHTVPHKSTRAVEIAVLHEPPD